ncbi:uncharacterized protein LOC125682866 [Ostrea edulis]|uniref:uncharacterized protein LOC125682866 n=1 Tax=Ostrea edulis TaxID=37623 RepID=UPI0024AFFF33|nr:uncharacterized protein LOC125682866 [Ostrea edulis]
MSHENIKDFGKSVYGKAPGIVFSYHGDDEKEDQVQKRPEQDENKSKYITAPKAPLRASFGNISVASLKRSLKEQLVEKEKKMEHESKCLTDQSQTPPIPNHGRVFDNQILSAGSSLYSKRKTSVVKNTDHVQTKASREKVNLNKSVTIKKPLLDDLSGVSVKDLSTNLIRLKLKRDREAERPISDQGDIEEHESSEFPHEHCLSCFHKNCNEMKDCPLVKCKNKCDEAIFHRCKQREHDEMCKHTIISCINKTIGCRMEMPRHKLWYHLKHCTKMTETVLRYPSFNCHRHSGDYQQALSPNRPTVKHKDIHEHCLHCHKISCSEEPECMIKRCSNKGCSMKLHACKIKDHKRICLFKEIPCINKEYGCQYKISRILLTEHLRTCPVMNFKALGLPPYNILQNINEQSHHCENCYNSNCTVLVDKNCMMKECDCGALLHACKWEDHYENTCPAFVMYCINFDAGCKMILTRGMLTTHLFHCPAMNWEQRKQLQSEEDLVKSDYPNINTELESTVNLDSDEHVYEKLPKRKKKGRKNCRVM